MKRFFQNENGQGMVEYALIISLIAIVVVGAVSLLGGAVRDFFTGFGAQIDSAVGSTPE